MNERTRRISRVLLREMYNERESGLVMDGLSGLLKKYRRAFPTHQTEKKSFSERDVILITYPDQIREEGAPPLKVLSEFFERHLGEAVRHLHILPFYPSSSDDGFSVIDYRRVDPEWGTWEEIARLSKNYSLMLDAVINHASVRGDWFQAFLRDENAYRNFFIEAKDCPDLSQVVRPRPSPLLHRFGAAPAEKTVWTTFSDDQVDLNYKNPRVLLEMTDLLLYYAARGAAILRLDAVAYLWKESGTACINLPQTHRIVQLLRAVIEEAAPGVKLATETNVPHAENIAYFGDGSNEAHLVYNFALPPLVLDTFHTGDHRRLSGWEDSLSHPGRDAAFLNFLASHDGIGLNPVRDILPAENLQRLIQTTLDHGGRISYKQNPDGGTQPYELNINYFDALSNPFGNEPLELQIRRFLCAHAVLLSLAGVPALYFHSLFGSRGWREGIEQTGLNRTINRQKLFRADLERELADPSGFRRRVFSGLIRLIQARKNSSAFDPWGSQRTLDCGSAVFSLLRIPSQTGEPVLCLHNVTESHQVFSLDVDAAFGPVPAGAWITDLIGGGSYDPRLMNPFLLEPFQVCWLTPHGGRQRPEKERSAPA